MYYVGKLMDTPHLQLHLQEVKEIVNPDFVVNDV